LVGCNRDGVTPALGHSEDWHHSITRGRQQTLGRGEEVKECLVVVQAESLMLALVWMSPSRSHASRLDAGELTDVVTHCPFASRTKRKGKEVVSAVDIIRLGRWTAGV